jgi:hypothetical protein
MEMKDQWPAPEFLKWHTDKFDKNTFKLKASADYHNHNCLIVINGLASFDW